MNNATDILTLENFWNEMKLKYPKSVQEWCDWVDAYKVKTHLKVLFNEKTILSPVSGFDPIKIHAPKIHALPIALQVGLFIQYRFDLQLEPGLFEINEDWKSQFVNFFRHRELILSNREIEY